MEEYKLIKAREEISAFDREMASLFVRRMNAVRIVSEYKTEHGLPVYDAAREESLLAMCQAANPNITDLGWPYAFFAVLPLNLIKDAIVIAATFLVYRSLHVFLRYQRN